MQETCLTLEDLYPEGIPLDFHIALGNITYALDVFFQRGEKGRYIIDKSINVAEEILRKELPEIEIFALNAEILSRMGGIFNCISWTN